MKEYSAVDIKVVSSIPAGECKNGLVPRMMKALPCGSISPAGWLKRQLDIELQGIPGQLWKHSPFLADGNGWMHPEKLWWGSSWDDPCRPWEEGAYWLRTFIKLAILTQDATALGVAKRYMEAMGGSVEADGWFGPQYLKHYHSDDRLEEGEVVELWSYMVLMEGVYSWYEYTGDSCWLERLHNFLVFCNRLPPERMIPYRLPGRHFHWMGDIQKQRACNMLPVIYAVVEATGDESLLELARKLYRKWGGPNSEFLCTHTVNFAQCFAYDALYSRVSKQSWQRNASEYWYRQHTAVWGTVPRGAYCADENIRAGCTDPRYANESCTWAELTRSFNLLGELNAEPIWADRAEDVLFNHYPAAYTQDMKGLHYLTASNQVMLDDYARHNVCNRSHQMAYSSTENRCCLHNAGLGWPLYAEYLMTSTADDGVCAWLHGAYTAQVRVGKNQVEAQWTSETDYPFRQHIRFVFHSGKSVCFPFYIRIPRWCQSPILKLNDSRVSLQDAGGKLVRIERQWADGDQVWLELPAEITLSENPRNGGVTVDRGPFSYSLRIKEVVHEVVSNGSEDAFQKEDWNEAAPKAGSRWTELLPGSPWNYGLLPEKGFELQERPIPAEAVFSWNTAPLTIQAWAKRIPAWTLQDHMCAPLQKSPVLSNEKLEQITLIPMGCARLRLSVFPVIGDAPEAVEWQKVPDTTPEEQWPKRR